MFERFDRDARHAVVRARQEAAQAGQDGVGTEHLLTALLAEPGVAADALAAAGLDVAGLRARLPAGSAGRPEQLDADALASLGIDLDAVRRATDAAFGPDALERVATWRGRRGITSGPRFRPDAKKALELTVRSASRLGHHHMSSGHVLLGIIDQPGNPALDLLADLEVSVAALRADVTRRLARAA
ncbi:MAG: Clp protease N-terminal domain-containing protein [Streptosporangiaceae bacterium]